MQALVAARESINQPASRNKFNYFWSICCARWPTNVRHRTQHNSSVPCMIRKYLLPLTIPYDPKAAVQTPGYCLINFFFSVRVHAAPVDTLESFSFLFFFESFENYFRLSPLCDLNDILFFFRGGGGIQCARRNKPLCA